jgi:predicted Ser/Thr protein kinase
MSLAPGWKLGPYEILAPIGAGGMGEVYRARDSKLKRDVALKVLPEVFAHDPDRMARFEREAQVLASLNHPNIAAIYGVEERALVMELVEGQTLKGPLLLETALQYARQIADALEAAHEKGIVHRDLKPANVMITAGGLVKVLDFGLAAVMEGPAGDPASSPTLTMRATKAGVIMGTAGYMSPEQASGKPVDKRADIWSFGVLLWEMLTGKRLFEGETVSHTLAAVLTKDPDWTQLPARTPTAILRLLRRCLERDVKRRLPDIGSARLEIDEALAAGPEARTGQAEGTRQSKLPWAMAAVLGLGLMAVGALYWRATRPVERPLVRLDVDLGPDVSLPGLGADSLGLSPDGTRLLYLSGNPPRLFTRRMDQPTAAELPGTEGAQGPFFSPDGQWVGFFAANKVNKISVAGGAVVPLADYPIIGGGSWGADGSIILGGALQGGLARIPDSGGVPTRLTEFAKGEIAHVFPQVLPGGKAVLFAVYGASVDADHASIEVVSLTDRHRKVLVRGGVDPRYLPNGHLVYGNKGTLFAIPFDPVRLETHGTAVPVLDHLAYSRGGDPEYDVSATGTLVYRKGGGAASTMHTVQWVDATGRKEPLRAKPGNYQSGALHLSPDGKRLVILVNEGAGQDFWVYDIQRETMNRLTFGGNLYTNVVWTPDGRNVVFGAVGGGLFWTRADGGGQPQLLIESKNIQAPQSFTPDGKRLAYDEFTKAGAIFTVVVEEQGGQLKADKPEPFLETQYNSNAPVFSPDGRWLAYASDESGKTELYVRAFPQSASGQGGKWQISNSGGNAAWWSRDGRELLYQAGDQIMAVNYMAKGETFVAEKPRVWQAKVGGRVYDLSPDGKRVVVLAPVDAAEVPKPEHEVTLLFNFLDELRLRAPTGK